MNDEEIFQQALGGSQPALEELVARYYGQLRAYFYRLVNGNLPDAEDLVQETFLRILHYKGKAPHTFRPWIYTVAHNLAYDFFRSAHYKRELVGINADPIEDEADYLFLPQADAADHVLEAKLLEQVSADAIYKNLYRLPMIQREVIIMRFYGEMKLEEIAVITGCPVGTVKSRLCRGLKMYKRILEEVEYDKE
ncbi:MAG: RNA polymerase sigma factor [Anaerolineaceae bacterium]